jgi:hypothetical protein
MTTPTPEQIEQALRPLLQIYRESGGESRPLVDHVLAVIRAAAEAARAEEREANCKAVCFYCRQNGKPEYRETLGWVHTKLSGTNFGWLPCKAAAIRAREEG